MATGLRQTGIDILGERPWGTHFCNFYQTRQDLEDIVIPYLNAGLSNNEVCQFVIAEPLSRDAWLLLEQAIPGFHEHTTNGSLEFLLYSQCFFENGNYYPEKAMALWERKLEQVPACRISGLRVAVDGAWMEEKYWSGFSRFEKAIDPVYGEKNIMILCAYPLSLTKASVIFDVTETHQFAVVRQHGRWKVFKSPELKQARAEIKQLNAELEQKVIERTNALAKANEELRREIHERETSVEFLRLLNESKSTEDLIRKAIDFIAKKTGCESVGIRLKKEHDYPYYATIGFSENFVFLENSLCPRNEKRALRTDNSGNPLLECVCGIVISGRSEPAQPFFTPMGSFWTNNLTEVFAQTDEETKRREEIRGRCHAEGYESVALIPLRCGNERLGLLQFNDRRKNLFCIETITMWERLADYLSVSICKLETDEALQRVNETLEKQVEERTAMAETRTKQLQSLAVEMVEAEEFERRRIADLLHNDLQQLIASARMQVHLASGKNDPGPILMNVERLLGDSIEKSRRLSHELSPPVLHQFGLAAALEWLGRNMHEQFGLDVRLAREMTHQIKDAPLNVFLFRAAQELLFNCVKHAGVKRADLHIYDTDNTVVLSVSDQGKGFDPGILDAFARKGGLGLVSLRERAAAIGGKMDIESASRRGSRFTLTVPISLDIKEEPEKLNLTTALTHKIPGTQKPVSAPEPIRVLFADDHKVMRQGLIGIVSDQPNIQIAGEAADGEEALALARQLKPDVVVMDISMPKMDGMEATRRIRAEMPEVRVIGLSMFEDDDITGKMAQAGADAFVSKSESSAKLLKAIYESAGIKSDSPG